MTKELRERFEERYDHYNPIHDTGEWLPYWNPADWNDMITFIEQEIIEAERRMKKRCLKTVDDLMEKHRSDWIYVYWVKKARTAISSLK